MRRKAVLLSLKNYQELYGKTPDGKKVFDELGECIGTYHNGMFSFSISSHDWVPRLEQDNYFVEIEGVTGAYNTL